MDGESANTELATLSSILPLLISTILTQLVHTHNSMLQVKMWDYPTDKWATQRWDISISVQVESYNKTR